MTKFLGFCLGMLLGLAWFMPAHAATYNVQRNGVPLFCAASIQVSGTIYNFLNDCTVQPPPPPAAGRQVTSRVGYSPGNGITPVRDVTTWNSVFGHASDSDAVIAFPGRRNSQPTIMDFLRTNYLGLQVDTGDAGTIVGWLVHQEYNYGGDLSFAWSRSAGDFSVALLPGAACAGATLSGQTIGQYTTRLTGYPSFCHLPPNTRVYLNIRLTNPNQVTNACPVGSRTCAIGFSNNF